MSVQFIQKMLKEFNSTEQINNLKELMEAIRSLFGSDASMEPSEEKFLDVEKSSDVAELNKLQDNEPTDAAGEMGNVFRRLNGQLVTIKHQNVQSFDFQENFSPQETSFQEHESDISVVIPGGSFEITNNNELEKEFDEIFFHSQSDIYVHFTAAVNVGLYTTHLHFPKDQWIIIELPLQNAPLGLPIEHLLIEEDTPPKENNMFEEEDDLFVEERHLSTKEEDPVKEIDDILNENDIPGMDVVAEDPVVLIEKLPRAVLPLHEANDILTINDKDGQQTEVLPSTPISPSFSLIEEERRGIDTEKLPQDIVIEELSSSKRLDKENIVVEKNILAEKELDDHHKMFDADEAAVLPFQPGKTNEDNIIEHNVHAAKDSHDVILPIIPENTSDKADLAPQSLDQIPSLPELDVKELPPLSMLHIELLPPPPPVVEQNSEDNFQDFLVVLEDAKPVDSTTTSLKNFEDFVEVVKDAEPVQEEVAAPSQNAFLAAIQKGMGLLKKMVIAENNEVKEQQPSLTKTEDTQPGNDTTHKVQVLPSVLDILAKKIITLDEGDEENEQPEGFEDEDDPWLIEAREEKQKEQNEEMIAKLIEEKILTSNGKALIDKTAEQVLEIIKPEMDSILKLYVDNLSKINASDKLEKTTLRDGIKLKAQDFLSEQFEELCTLTAKKELQSELQYAVTKQFNLTHPLAEEQVQKVLTTLLDNAPFAKSMAKNMEDVSQKLLAAESEFLKNGYMPTVFEPQISNAVSEFVKHFRMDSQSISEGSDTTKEGAASVEEGSLSFSGILTNKMIELRQNLREDEYLQEEDEYDDMFSLEEFTQIVSESKSPKSIAMEENKLKMDFFEEVVATAEPVPSKSSEANKSSIDVSPGIKKASPIDIKDVIHQADPVINFENEGRPTKTVDGIINPATTTSSEEVSNAIVLGPTLPMAVHLENYQPAPVE
ncbi:MAG: hypothetical protein BGO43_02040 [Gammaproteobacteria bacterium 39-13]|mgnify:CR=1 FL=1|nr:hypothetical protein [Gammaproteobacteria bacterium]OJV91862.1 MAG: hypothetical protein BGO43_02040 [Gammaproteobacteria bacterium 39-13]